MANPRQPNTPGFQRLLQTLLDQRGWTAADLARAASDHRPMGQPRLSTSTVTRILNGDTRTITYEVFATFQAALENDLSEASVQQELDLDIADAFIERAREAIEDHVRKLDLDLNGATDMRLIGVVGLRVEQAPSARVYERLFDLPVPSRRPRAARRTA